MFNVADLAKYSPYYEVYWRKGFQESSDVFAVDDLEDAEKLYDFKKKDDRWGSCRTANDIRN